MLRGIPPDEPELESDDEFFKELCDLMEKHHDERDLTLEALLFNMRSFCEEWLFTLYMTGRLWEPHHRDEEEE